MAQRLTQLQRVFYGVESSEGDGTLGTATEAFLAIDPSMTLDQTVHQRKFRSNMGWYSAKVGGQPAPAISFGAELRNRGATSNVPDIEPLINSVFGTKTTDSGDTTCGASCTTTVLDVVDSSNFTAGNAIAVETTASSDQYEVGWILSVDSGTQITLENALSFTPASGAAVKPSVTYAPASSGHQSLAFQVWLDATDYVLMYGCKGTARIEIPEAGAIPMINFDWQAIRWAHVTGGSRPSQTFGDSGLPPVAISSIFKLGANQVDIRSFTADLGQTIARKTSHNSTKGTSNLVVADRDPSWGISLYDVDQTYFTAWNSGTEYELMHQSGNTLYNMVAVWMPKAQPTSVSYGDDSGLTTNEIEGQAAISSGNDEIKLAFL